MSKSSLALAALPDGTVEALVLFGRFLRLARKRRDMPIRRVAELAGVAPRTVMKIERGDSSVALRLVAEVMLSLNLGLDFEELARTEKDESEHREQIRDVEMALSVMPPKERALELLRRFGMRIRAIRKARRLTILHMTNVMHVSPVTVRKLETGSPSTSLGIAAMALFCLRHDEDLKRLAAPDRDRSGISNDISKQTARKRVRLKAQ